ncbi:MaoC family dehydratase N-terminal domain-containing protein [Fodinicola feengrottensis]|uniref:MaoC family dehydratase N-terminal domain-containing protein n=1 Tax=Fodinicola feengrottensis TaxID=435914 RepID=A0ABN2HZ50_9ACTN
MSEPPEAFAAIEANWRPHPETSEDVITVKPPETFAALLDQPAPVRTAGDPLPPLWHWFFFDTIHPQATLGQDGHPANASFTPPLPHRRRMFGGGRLTVHQPLRCGDQVQRRSSLGSVRVRHGSTGWLLLVTVRHEFLVGGQLRVLEEQDLVYRDADDLRSGPTAPPEMTEPAERGPWQLRVRPDPVLLFRFSALTHNAHRIHYDQPYATQVEGHPGLVVHGPLLALLLLELPRREAPDRTVRDFRWRACRPLFDHQLVTVSGGSGGELTAGAAGAPDAVTGQVTLDEESE